MDTFKLATYFQHKHMWTNNKAYDFHTNLQKPVQLIKDDFFADDFMTAILLEGMPEAFSLSIQYFFDYRKNLIEYLNSWIKDNFANSEATEKDYNGIIKAIMVVSFYEAIRDKTGEWRKTVKETFMDKAMSFLE